MIYVGEVNKQESADAIMLTFISLKFNTDLLILVTLPVSVNN